MRPLLPITQRAGLLFGASPAIGAMLRTAAALALGSDPILILGESGAGKTELARNIHDRSARPGSFIKQSIAEIPQELLVSALAGHRRGSFTGAIEDRVGLVESARNGTLFLDEIDTASPSAQATLLGFLERSFVQRLGEERVREVGVRFIVATNADLSEMSQQGQFRRDLRNRFGYSMLRVPPLRERRDEIHPLAERFVAEQAVDLRIAPPPITKDVGDMLMAAQWFGNIRELRSVCRIATLFSAVHSEGEVIAPEHLPPDFVASLGEIGRARKPKRHVTRLELQETLANCGNNKRAAARALGIRPSSVHRILKREP
jgi:DNA-binding NtrC family response regulator